MKKIKPIVLLFIVVIILALGFYPMESYISRPGELMSFHHWYMLRMEMRMTRVH